jgi:hypothetical protein
MPGESGVTVATLLVCSFHLHARLSGASSARHSLRPLMYGGRCLASLGRGLRRGNAMACLRSLEIQSKAIGHALVANHSVVPGKAGTHNHRLSLERKPSAIAPKSEAAAYGSRVRGDDVGSLATLVARRYFKPPETLTSPAGGRGRRGAAARGCARPASRRLPARCHWQPRR